MDAIRIESYDALVLALRNRVCEINTTYACVDDVAGLPARYTSKLLAAWPAKNLGARSLMPLLHVLALRLQLVRDDELLTKLRRRSDWVASDWRHRRQWKS
jgi:hypothetical protein